MGVAVGEAALFLHSIPTGSLTFLNTNNGRKLLEIVYLSFIVQIFLLRGDTFGF
jgi:hypothetical protein